jgi:uncharacterized protein YuzE
MRYQYDADADVLLIDVQSGKDVSSTVEVDDARHVDLDDDGRVVRIEVLWASAGVKLQDLIDRFDLQNLRPLLEDIENHTFKPAASHA